MKKVIVLIGSGQIGQAIARRVGYGKHIVLTDMRRENANAAAEVFRNAGFEVSDATVDVSATAGRAGARQNRNEPRRSHGSRSRGRRVALASVAGNDPQG